MPQHKQFPRVEIKDEDRGEVEAVFSTFDVIDSDGDITLAGAFTDNSSVAMSAYGHRSWTGELPVGKGTIRETSKEAIFSGKFFMDTQAGSDTFRTVKEMGDLQEWSYGYQPKEWEYGERDGQQVRILKTLDVTEVSPVLKGAGVDTRTITAKGDQPVPFVPWTAGNTTSGYPGPYVYLNSGENVTPQKIAEALRAEIEAHLDRRDPDASGDMKLSEEATSVLTGVKSLLDRATEVVTLRAEKGKSIAPSTAEILMEIVGELERFKDLLNPPTNKDDDQAAHELMRFLRSGT